jgi:hypothetical protein
VGTLRQGEIVAVTHMIGNRLRVRRLCVSLDEEGGVARDGWVSEQAGGGNAKLGRLLMERLPRSEWTSVRSGQVWTQPAARR